MMDSSPVTFVSFAQCPGRAAAQGSYATHDNGDDRGDNIDLSVITDVKTSFLQRVLYRHNMSMSLMVKDNPETGDAAPVDLPLDLSVKNKVTDPETETKRSQIEPEVVAKRSKTEPEVNAWKRARTLSSTSSGNPPQVVDNNALRASVVVLSPIAPNMPNTPNTPIAPVPNVVDAPSSKPNIDYASLLQGHGTASLFPSSLTVADHTSSVNFVTDSSSPLSPISIAAKLDATRLNAAVAPASIYQPRNNLFSPGYNSFYEVAAAAAAAAAATSAATASPLAAAQYSESLQQREQRQIQIQQIQQQQIHQQQQLQMQLQQQLDFNAMMHAQTMTGPLSSSSEESIPFMFGSAYDRLAKPTYGFGYPYFNGLLGGGFGGSDIGGGVLGSHGDGIDSNRSTDNGSPESTTVTAGDHGRHRSYREPVVYHRHRDIVRRLHASLMTLHRSEADSSSMDTDPEPEEIAAIYRQSDFLSFRQRYIDNLGPPRNFEKMRRSVPNKKIGNGGGQQSYDQTYVVKRQKNNEAAKKSRDAKRQKYIENQISVMYLTKKVSEMKDIKRRLLLEMK